VQDAARSAHPPILTGMPTSRSGTTTPICSVPEGPARIAKCPRCSLDVELRQGLLRNVWRLPIVGAGTNRYRPRYAPGSFMFPLAAHEARRTPSDGSHRHSRARLRIWICPRGGHASSSSLPRTLRPARSACAAATASAATALPVDPAAACTTTGWRRNLLPAQEQWSETPIRALAENGRSRVDEVRSEASWTLTSR
jgi:hypothetical protein